MLPINRHLVRFAAVFSIAIVIWFVGGRELHRMVVQTNNATQIEELAQQLAARVEKAIDFVVIANSDFLIAGHMACGPAALEHLRRVVVQTGTISDAYLVTPDTSCSTFGALSRNLPALDERSAWAQARNPNYRFGPLTDDRAPALGVSWGLGSDMELVTAISADALLFDVLPVDLRGSGRLQLTVGEMPVTRLVGTDALDAATVAHDVFIATGARYPVTVEITIPSRVLAGWRDAVPAPVRLGWLLLGLGIALLAGWTSVRGRQTEVDDVRRALERGDILPHFQPIVNLRDGRVVGSEALARWRKADGSMVSPARFIPMIEQSGLNARLIRHIVAATARDLGGLLAVNPHLYVSINITPDDLGDAGFASMFMELARTQGLEPNQICIELTERQEIKHLAQATATIRALKEHGFRVAIDDAGTGHNGLATIQSFEASALKIDKFFIDHMHEGDRSTVMLDMFVAVANRFRMTTIAEGVETAEQASILLNAGIDCAQGYLFSPALPAPQFVALAQAGPLAPRPVLIDRARHSAMERACA